MEEDVGEGGLEPRRILSFSNTEERGIFGRAGAGFQRVSLEWGVGLPGMNDD